MKKAKQTAVQIQQDELNFGVDEATEVLYAQYVGKVDVKVKAAEERSETAREAHKDILDTTLASIDTEKFNHVSETLGISSRVTDVRLDIGKTVTDSNIRIVIMLTDLDIDKHYTPEFGKYRKLPMSVEMHTTLIASEKRREDVQKETDKVHKLRQNASDVRRLLKAEVVKAQLLKMDLGHLINSSAVVQILDI